MLQGNFLRDKCPPGDRATFAVTMGKFGNPFGLATLLPRMTKLSTLNYCVFYTAAYIAYIKVDEGLQGVTFSAQRWLRDHRLE